MMTDASYKICQKCGHKNESSLSQCDECGASLGAQKTRRFSPEAMSSMKSEDQKMLDTIYVRQEKRNFTRGTSVFEGSMSLRLDIQGMDKPVVLSLDVHPLIIGRHDPEDSYQPDVDLGGYDAFQHGISRRHAAFTRTGNKVEVRDLQSSNGTYLNNVLLDPNEPHQVRDGDQLRLGSLSVYISFEA